MGLPQGMLFLPPWEVCALLARACVLTKLWHVAMDVRIGKEGGW